ncbi:DNA repair protein RadC [Ferrimonas sediminum]|uniref:DNA repair protein RadC n=1 Tax=Ferrimonas sediminum TaxID=718193 RepID=A0A1G8XMC5_9GAMM|nr:DNA repair protein RadC [Ferrimonas sediminum]SDJ91731.1 DNA repair protein RadC [Ferrimonas sediminum]
MAIRDWPETERPRERLLTQGVGVLSDAELLAIFLRTGIAGCSAVELARQLLTEAGGLNRLLAMDRRQFADIRGVGPAKYAQLQAALELGRRCLGEKSQRACALTSPDSAREYLQVSLGNLGHEVFAMLLLDSQHRVVKLTELFRGTIDAANVYPREVVKTVLAANAAAVILAHNHPSGVSEPSQADRAITKRIQNALALIDVSVLDHLVIGHGECCSFAQRGWL